MKATIAKTMNWSHIPYRVGKVSDLTYFVILCVGVATLIFWNITISDGVNSYMSAIRLLFETTDSSLHSTATPKQDSTSSRGPQKVIKIVFWSPFLRWTSNFGLKKKRFTNNELGCVIHKTPSNCQFSYYKEEVPSANIVFTFFSDWAIWYKDLPKYQRSPQQLWIFFETEAPPQMYHPNWNTALRKKPWLKEWKGLFNLTMTYRLDSDIYTPYGFFIPKAKPDMSLLYDRLGSKQPIALFMMSNCRDRHSRRLDYAKALMEAGLKVEHIGHCKIFDPKISSPLTKLCPRNASVPSNNEECYPELSKRYAFYLSFENSICTDYVTEKFFRACKLDMIPIVINGANMSAVAPKNSFINARDFKSPRHLVEYLHMLVNNRSLYNSYFEWKPYYDVVDMIYETAFSETLCMLCEKSQGLLEKAATTTMVVDDIDDWWTAKGNCRRGPTLEELRHASKISESLGLNKTR